MPQRRRLPEGDLRGDCRVVFAGAGLKHAGHVHTLNGLVAGIGMVVIGELMGGKVIGSMCGGQPGGEGAAAAVRRSRPMTPPHGRVCCTDPADAARPPSYST